MRIYIIRHGDPNYEKDCLTERGKLEAQALADFAPRLGFTRLYASPLGRTQETAAYVAGALDMPLTTLPWARELSGVYYDVPGFRQHSPFTVPGEVMYRHTPLPQYEAWQDMPYSGGDAYAQRLEEMTKGSDALLARHGYRREGRLYACVAPNEERIAVFCHHGLTVTWLSHLLTLPVQAAWAGLWLACTSVTTIVLERRSRDWSVPRALGIGDVSHLRCAGLADKESGFFESPE